MNPKRVTGFERAGKKERQRVKKRTKAQRTEDVDDGVAADGWWKR